MSAVIQVQALAKTYRSGWFRRRALQVLRDLTFDVGAGEVFGLLGPNGAGKTTFIKILLGIIRPSGGQARVLGYSAGSRKARRRIGYLPENLRIPRHHTGRSALAFYGQLSGLSAAQARRRSDELLPLVGLAERANDRITEYSKGMLQRLGLAQALLHDPQLVILDEPTDGLDPVGRSHVRAVLGQLRDEGKTVFLNSHILQEVELVCDRVAILDRGELRYVGSVAEVHEKVGDALGGISGSLEELDIQFELAGDERAAREVLSTWGTQPQWEPGPGNSFRVHLRLPDQAAVDRTVDALRQRGVSLVGLTPRRISLEEAFLALVKPTDSPPN